jgi:8-oxo-dGTP pyrophosphatase MutT (NUDIX family)
LEEYSWEIPEGGCPIGEDVLEAAKRELLEETGLMAQNWTMISRIHTSNSVCNEVGFIFLAENLTQGDAEPEETEDLKIKKLTLKAAVELVMNNQITDSISIAGLLKVARLKGV